MVLDLMTRLKLTALAFLIPAALLAESGTPSIGYTGAPADHGGQDCSTCHNSYGPANSNPAGSVQVMVNDYAPNATQLIRIIVQDAQASRWGFQMTIRGQSTPNASAGTLALASPPGPVQIVCDDGTQYGSATGCTNTPLRTFAEHFKAPTTIGSSYEFDVNWTPPPQEIGRIEVYVAAVGANGDGTPAGDHVYTALKTLQNIGKCDYTTVPTLNAVLNAASFQTSVSPLAMVSITGENFQLSGYTRTAGLGDYVNNAYPTELSCVSVQAQGPGGGSPVLLPITYVDSSQINAQLPASVGTGPVTLTVLMNPGDTNELESPTATLNPIPAFAPAFFLFPKSMNIAAEEAVTGTIVADSSVVAGASSAHAGDIVSLFGTGFGGTNPSVPAGQMASGIATLTSPITVTIGNTTLASSDVLYAGLSPGSIGGLYQFNVRIPANTPSGEAPVTISIGGFQTQAGVTIPIQ